MLSSGESQERGPSDTKSIYHNLILDIDKK